MRSSTIHRLLDPPIIYALGKREQKFVVTFDVRSE